jgi:hypothetical protein
MDIKEIKHNIEQVREDLDLEVANYEAFQQMAQDYLWEQELRELEQK